MMGIVRNRPTIRLAVAGASRSLLGGGTVGGARSAFPTATLLLDPAEGKPNPGDLVEVHAGYDGGAAILFRGEADANGIVLAPNEIEVQATHILARTRESIGTPPSIVDGVAEQSYFLAWEGATAATIIGDILATYGVTQYSLADSGRTFGNLEPVGLMAGDSGWSLIEQLDEVEGYRTFGTEDGGVVRQEWSGLPSGTPGRTFTQGVDLYAGRLGETRIGTFNRVIASGLPQIGTTGIDFVPTDEANAPSAWIPSPPTYRAFSYNSPLFETGDECAAYCTRKLGELNRLRGEMPFDLATGDPTLRPGLSVAVDALRLDVRATVRFRVLEVAHNFDGGFHTSGTLLLASEGTGWSPNQPPIALIAATAKVEYLADGAQITTVNLDGSASYDPELGVAGIVSYVWGGSPVVPTPFNAGMRAVVVYEGAIPAGAYVTLTVTDNLGKTGTTKLPITATAVPLKVRHLLSAEKTRLQVTRDGGKTWVSVTIGGVDIPAVGVTEFAASAYGFAWDAAGTLYKVLVDNTASVVLSGAGVTACGITLVNGDPDQPTGRVWAASSDGSVRRSRADGATGTWDVLAALPNGQAATYILESAFAEGDVEAASANVYWRSFDNGGAWVAQFTHPNTALLARRVASGFGKGWVGFSGGSGLADAATSRIRERTNAVTLDALAPAKPLSIQGLALDPFEPTAYVLDVDNGGIGRAFTGDTAIGGNLTDTGSWDTVAWGVPRHMVRDGTSPAYLYISAVDALLKSVDGLATIRALKLLSGGAEGEMIGYGAEVLVPLPVVPVGVLTSLAAPMSGVTWVTASPHLIRLTATGWIDVGTVPLTMAMDTTRLLKFGTGKYLAWNYHISDAPTMTGTEANIVVTTDDGASWHDGGLTGAISVAATDAGELYALAIDPWVSGNRRATVYHSADDGATWAARANVLHSDTAVIVYHTQIGVHPTDATKVVLKTYAGVVRSTDGGATFGTLVGPGQGGNIHTGALLVAGDGVITWTSNEPDSHSTIRRLAFGAGSATELTPEAAIPPYHIQRFGARLYIGGAVGTGDGVEISLDDGASWSRLATTAQDAVPQAESVLILARVGSVGGFGPYTYSDFWVARDSGGTETDLTASQIAALGVPYRAWSGSTTD